MNGTPRPRVSAFNPAPWQRAILDGSATFFVGAGISRPPPASLPLAAGLIERLVSPILGSLPLPPALFRRVLSAFTQRLRPEVVSDILLEHLGSRALDPLLGILSGRPNAWHFFLAAAMRRGCCVVTVNFDNLIEEACHLVGASFVSVVPPAGLPAVSPVVGGAPTSILFKMHGSIGDPPSSAALSSIVLAVRQVGRGLPLRQMDALRTLVVDRPLIVLGYSGRDDFDIQPVLRAMPRTARCLWVLHDSAVAVPRPASPSTLRRSVAQPARECAAEWSGPFDLLAGDTSSVMPLLRPRAGFGRVVGRRRRRGGIPSPVPPPTRHGTPRDALSALAVLYELIECRDFLLAREVLRRLDQLSSMPSREATRLQIAEAVVLEKEGVDFRKAGAVAEAAVTQATKSKEPFPLALALDQSGVIARRRGRYTEAAGFYLQALRATRKGRCPTWLVMQIRGHRAVALDYLKRHREALREHRIVGAWERKVGDLRGVAKTLNNIGIVHLSLKEWDKGIRIHEESRELKKLLGDSRGMAQSLHNIGKIHYKCGDYPSAEAAFTKSLRLRLGPARDRHGAAQSFVALGHVAQKMKRRREALEYAKRALTAHIVSGDKMGAMQARTLLRSLTRGVKPLRTP